MLPKFLLKSNKRNQTACAASASTPIPEKSVIGEPSSVNHILHVEMDHNSNSLIGLPKEWEEFLKKNNIRYNYSLILIHL